MLEHLWMVGITVGVISTKIPKPGQGSCWWQLQKLVSGCYIALPLLECLALGKTSSCKYGEATVLRFSSILWVDLVDIIWKKSVMCVRVVSPLLDNWCWYDGIPVGGSAKDWNKFWCQFCSTEGDVPAWCSQVAKPRKGWEKKRMLEKSL